MLLQQGVTVGVSLQLGQAALTILNVRLGHFVRGNWRLGCFLGYKDPHDRYYVRVKIRLRTLPGENHTHRVATMMGFLSLVVGSC